MKDRPVETERLTTGLFMFVFSYKNINGKIYCFNYQFIMNIINVLKIKSTFMIKYYGVDNPAIVRNDEGEIAFMPVINMLYLI